MVLSTCMEEDAMSRRTILFAFGLITVLTGILALLDGRIAVIYASFCVVFAIVMIDLAERPAPTVHERVRRRKVRQAAARRN
jgi:Ca2+/Na+ antiporter